MSERLEALIAIVAVIVVAVLWWGFYVQPKNATLESARVCMADQGIDISKTRHEDVQAPWAACLKVAESEHSNQLVALLGY